MSNPGVIILADDLKSNNRFQIEDNIGEAIHVHMNNVRFDLSINEFLAFAGNITDIVKNMDLSEIINIDDYDVAFLYEISDYLNEITKIVEEEIPLKRLTCISREKIFNGRLLLQKELNIKAAPVYQYLMGNKLKYLSYYQKNYFHNNNKNRIETLFDSIKKLGFHNGMGKIVLFGDQNCIRDGQHRACILAYLEGLDFKVKIHRFYFKRDFIAKFDNPYTITKQIFNKIFRKILRIS